MQNIDALKDKLPEAAKDLRIGIGSVLQSESLSPAQRWSVALSCAFAARNPELRDAVLADAKAAGLDEGYLDDARAAAAMMGMNNIFYRARHMLGKDAYNQRPARLRMQRIGQPKSNKADFELMCLAVSAINGCEACLASHEHVVIEAGLSEDQVFDAIRIASVVHGFAVSLELAV
jgi:alkyl hydroperoxide reductase subunit D